MIKKLCNTRGVEAPAFLFLLLKTFNFTNLTSSTLVILIFVYVARLPGSTVSGRFLATWTARELES